MTATPPGLVWVDELPPPADRSPALPHSLWAAAMRSRPGRWLTLQGLPAAHVGLVSGACPAAPYRPSRLFETFVDQTGAVYARYVGTGDER